MSAARGLADLGNQSTLNVDTTNTEVGIASAVPSSTLDVRGEVRIGTAIQAGTAGVITATNFSGSGANLTGVASTDNIITGTAATFRNTAVNAGVPNVNIVGLATVGIITAYGALEGTTGTFSGALSGSTGTFSGAVNVDDTTDSTSSTSGALIVDGGLGVAKNVYIGAGLSVAGTLTYEDVTNVDSVGMITAKSGVNISGGELKVGTAVTIGSAGIITSMGGTLDLKNSGSVSNIKLYCESGNSHYTQIQSAAHGSYSGNVTLTLPVTTDTLIGRTTTDTLTNKTLTAPTIDTASFSSNLTVGSGITFGSAGVATFSGTSDVHLLDNVRLNVGDASDLAIYHNGTNSKISNSTGTLYIEGTTEIWNSAGSEAIAKFTTDGAVEAYYNNSKKWETTNDGTVTTGIATVSSNLHVGSGVTVYASAGIVSATSFHGDGSNLTGLSGGSFDNFDAWDLGGGAFDYIPQAFRWTDDIIGQTTTDRESPWTRVSNLTQVGDGMSQSGGIWTFPTTGMWKIDLYFVAKWTTSGGGETQYDFHRSTDSGGSYSIIGHFRTKFTETNIPIPVPMLVYLNCSNASTTRFKVTCENQNPYQMQLADTTSISFAKIAG